MITKLRELLFDANPSAVRCVQHWLTQAGTAVRLHSTGRVRATRAEDRATRLRAASQRLWQFARSRLIHMVRNRSAPCADPPFGAAGDCRAHSD